MDDKSICESHGDSSADLSRSAKKGDTSSEGFGVSGESDFTRLQARHTGNAVFVLSVKMF